MLTEMPDIILEQICDVFNYESVKHDHIHITGTIEHDAVNYTLYGNVLIDNIKYYFVIDSGNIAGTVVKYFGLEEQSYEQQEKEPISFIPIHENLYITNHAQYLIYMDWRNQDWFKELEHNYNYDRYFQPGSVVENYYVQKAKHRGLKPGYFSQFKNKVDKIKSSL